jgi:hypothetical protein
MPAEDQFQYDVFLSHSAKDKDRVLLLAKRLKEGEKTRKKSAKDKGYYIW